jgi:dTDP-4-amino-4,6-dideoxygalactose transaminase
VPAHRFFREEVGLLPDDVPVAMDASSRTVSLPLYPAMTDAEQDDVVEALARILDYYAS